MILRLFRMWFCCREFYQYLSVTVLIIGKLALASSKQQLCFEWVRALPQPPLGPGSEIQVHQLLPSQYGLRRTPIEMERLRLSIKGTGRLPEPLAINIFPEDGKMIVLNGHHTLEALREAGKITLNPLEYVLTSYTWEQFQEINFARNWVTPFDPRTHLRLAQTGGWKRLIRLMKEREVPLSIIKKFIQNHPEAYSIARSEIDHTLAPKQPFEGGIRDKETYLNKMDASMPVKIGQLLPGIPRDGIVYEPGAGSGNQSAAYASYYPNLLVVASDLDIEKVRHGQSLYPFDNLLFLKADGVEQIFLDNFLDAKNDSSTQHHFFTYTPPGFSTEPVERYHKITMIELRPGGIHSFRDFALAKWPNRVELELPNTPAPALAHAPFGIQSFAEMLRDYVLRYRAIQPQRDTRYDEKPAFRDGFIRFNLPKEIAMNFLWRMGYTSEDSIRNEGRELYGYSDPEEHMSRSQRHGGQVIFAEEQHNPFIHQNWWKPNGVRVFDPTTEKRLPLPSTNYIQFTRKPRPDDALRITFEPTASSAKPWLAHVSYRNINDGMTYDLVQVPDIRRSYVPFQITGDAILLYLNPAEERPALLVYSMNSSLNNAHYFGLVPEVISHLGNSSTPTNEDFESTLKSKALTVLDGSIRKKISYGTSSRFMPEPIGTNEVVEQVPVDMKGTAGQVFYFTERLQPFELNQLLSANHTGVIPNPLVELASYRIGLENGAHFNKWFGSAMILEDKPLKGIPVAKRYADLTESSGSNPFERVDHQNKFMRVIRGEMVHEFKDRKKTAPWDIAIPSLLSPDIFSVTPYTISDGIAYVGLEQREFASLQDRSMHARSYVIPTWRMEKGLENNLEARQSLKNKMELHFCLNSDMLLTLGSGYFPSMGSTAERVTPFAVRVDPDMPPKSLTFVPLSNLLKDVELILDLNTRLSVYRLAHALDLLNLK